MKGGGQIESKGGTRYSERVFLVLVLLSAHAEIVSVSRVQDFSYSCLPLKFTAFCHFNFFPYTSGNLPTKRGDLPNLRINIIF